MEGMNIKKVFLFLLIAGICVTCMSCSSDEDQTSIVGKWRSSYVDKSGYTISISYTFKEDGKYLCSASYTGKDLQRMQLETKGSYYYNDNSLIMHEEAYSVYTEEGGGSSSIGTIVSETLQFPARISGSTMELSNYKLSALYIGDLVFKRD